MRVSEFARLLRERGVAVSSTALLRHVKHLLRCLDTCELVHIYFTTPSLKKAVAAELERRGLGYRFTQVAGGSSSRARRRTLEPPKAQA